MEHAKQWLEGRSVLGVSVMQWALFLAVTIGILVVLRIVFGVARARLIRRSAGDGRVFDAYLVRLFDHTSPLTLVAVSVLSALSIEAVSPRGAVERTLRTLALLAVILQVGRWGNRLIDSALDQGFRFARFSESAARTAFGVVRFFAMAALWTSVAILALSTLNVAVAPLVAGLGVGGLAVGFALQRVLGDILCSVAIVLDRPFEVGDLIQTGEFTGTVETIGVKSTRVRSLGGEQIVFPNSDLIQCRIRNYRRMAERRVVFRFAVASSTPVATLDRIPGLVRGIIEGLETTRFDRAHLADLGASSVTFEVVYFVLGPDLDRAMDVQQRFILELLRMLEGLGLGLSGG
jgi:small-conductance mechanosensitive channel